jgi:hypothetical protein
MTAVSNVIDVPPLELLISSVHRPILELVSMQLENQRLGRFRIRLSLLILRTLRWRWHGHREPEDSVLFRYSCTKRTRSA